jgi:small subunit ribosomal protein S19e
MTSINDANTEELIERIAEDLREKIAMPQWALHVKTGVSRERQPERNDWWYIRAASVLMKIYKRNNVGVQRLRSYYGGLHRTGHKPAHFARGSGKIIRVVMQDLEKSGLVKKEKKGRVITPAGVKFLNASAKKIKAA